MVSNIFILPSIVSPLRPPPGSEPGESFFNPSIILRLEKEEKVEKVANLAAENQRRPHSLDLLEQVFR